MFNMIANYWQHDNLLTKIERIKGGGRKRNITFDCFVIDGQALAIRKIGIRVDASID